MAEGGDAALECNIAPVPWWCARSNVWFARGDWQVVMQCLRRALWWNPASDTALANMAGLMWELGCRDDAAQVEECVRAVATRVCVACVASDPPVW